MKILKFSVCILLLLLLCGCKYGADYVDPEERYVVTALGFENNDNGILVIMETMSAIEDSENPKKLYYGFGSDASTAVINAETTVPADVILSQCPVILIGDSVMGDNLKNIFDFCVSSYDISLSVQVLNCENVSEILSVKSGEISVGHKILRMLNHFEKGTDITKIGRFSNVLANDNKSNTFCIPNLITNDNNFNVDSLSVYENYFKKQKTALKDGKENE